MRRLARVALLAAVFAVAAGCTDSGPAPLDGPPTSDDSTSQSPVKGGNDLAPTLSGAAPAMPGARPGGTLTVWAGEADHPFTPSLDPSDTYYTSTIAIESGLLIRSLTQLVYDRQSGTMVLIPDLATDTGTPNADFTTWQFTLRNGIRFDNGRPVTARDVAFGIKRSFDRTAFPESPPYAAAYFLGGDTYQGPYRSPGVFRGVRVSGNLITLRMSRPFPDLPYYAAFPEMSPIPPGRASDPATYKHRPWATGPYQISSYSPGRSLVLDRNPYWDPGTDPGRHQYVHRFVFDFTHPVDHDAVRSLVTGPPPGPASLVAVDLGASEYRYLKSNAPSRLLLGPNPCTSIFYPDNRKIRQVAVRRALAYAFPYREAWRILGLIPGATAHAAGTALPPGLQGTAATNPIPGHRPGSTDPARARALLEAAGSLGFLVRYPYAADVAQQVQLKDAVVGAFTRAGFRVRAVRSTSALWADDILRNPAAPVNVRMVGWCADWPSASGWLQQTLTTHDPAAPEFLSGNFEYYSKPAVDARIAVIRRLPIHAQQAAAQALVSSIERRDLPMFPLRYFWTAMARGTRVHGVAIDSMLGVPTYKDVWIR